MIRGQLWKYLIAIATVIAAIGLRLALDPLFGEKFPYITFIFAIVVSAWCSGSAPAIVSLVLGFLSAFYFFASPRGSFQVSGLDGQIGAVSYALTGVFIIFVFRSIRAAEQRARESADQLTQQQKLLEKEIAERRAAQEATTHYLRRLVDAQEEERRRISRELHDQCGQELTALKLELKLLLEGEGHGHHSSDRVKSVYRLMDRIADEVHHLALKLRPAVLDELGLATAVVNYVQNWQSMTGTRVDCEIHGWGDSRISEELETALYRVLQEALTNVARHSEATAVNFILLWDVNGVSMIIEDNGRGFDVSAQIDVKEPTSHLGLIGMRERMTAVGGSLEVESQCGAGTSIFARIPGAVATVR